MTTADGFLTPQELADRYKVPLQTVYDWNHKGTGPEYLRLGRLIRYPIARVTAWERTRLVKGGAAS